MQLYVTYVHRYSNLIDISMSDMDINILVMEAYVSLTYFRKMQKLERESPNLTHPCFSFPLIINMKIV